MEANDRSLMAMIRHGDFLSELLSFTAARESERAEQAFLMTLQKDCCWCTLHEVKQGKDKYY